MLEDGKANARIAYDLFESFIGILEVLEDEADAVAELGGYCLVQLVYFEENGDIFVWLHQDDFVEVWLCAVRHHEIPEERDIICHFLCASKNRLLKIINVQRAPFVTVAGPAAVIHGPD